MREIKPNQSGSCALCPNDWRFDYAKNIAKEVGKHNQTYMPLVYNAETPDDIPEWLVSKFKGIKWEFAYIDEHIAIFDDVERDSKTHLLGVPVEHIHRLEILKRPDLLTKIMCASNMIVELLYLDEAYVDVSSINISTKSKEYEYMYHFHAHVQSRKEITVAELREKLYPYFYKDSEFYVEYD